MRAFIKKIIKKCDNVLRIEIDTLPKEGIDKLPNQLWPFMWFFIRQIKWPITGIAVTEGIFAVHISLMFWYVGELVKQESYTQAMILAGIALLAIRFVSGTLAEIFYHLVYNPFAGNLIRRQLYWYTSRQSLSFFQNDFAGRIANKLLQTGPSLRDAVKSTIGAVWFASIFTISNLWFMAHASIWLFLPLAMWLCGYALILLYFVPKVTRYSTIYGEASSHLTGQIVDSFTNILPIKYFARSHQEDRRVVNFLKDHGAKDRDLTGTIWLMSFIIDLMNISLLIATTMVSFWLIETQGQVGIAAMAMALPMALQATFQSGWIMYEVSGIFENIGRVQEGIEALSKPHSVVDKPKANTLEIASTKKIQGAEIVFKDVSFDYGQSDKPVLKSFNLHIPAGQRVGLVGRSGAGKSTITSLLVRAYDVRDGEILIEGQNIANVTQESLRKHITVVTQDSYLFHRSILDNIRYGRPDASLEEVMEAAKRAYAHEFILNACDNKGRKGYEAHVGERGVKLSGGQKQRIGIARAILKDAPILILDEATSALDSESEQAIQNALEGIMDGKTVIAVAHRLSTLRQMDRILVMDQGQIIEDGCHEDLANLPHGHYAKLWHMQSGGFLGEK